MTLPVFRSRLKFSLTLAGCVLCLPAAAQPMAPPLPAGPPPALFALNEPEEKMLFKLSSGGSYLGVDVAEIGAERARALQLPEERGVEITRIAPDSPAAKAGLKAGDVVLEYNGQRVEGTEQFIRLVRETPVGRTVKLLISRGGATQTLQAAIGKRPAMTWTGPGVDGEAMRKAFEKMRDLHIHIPDTPRPLMSWRTPVLGIEGEALEGQLAAYFGVSSGVLVRSVLKDTPAEKAGLKAGDVILKVGDAKVTTPREISSAIRALARKKTFPLLVRRNQQDLTLNVTIEDAEGQRRPGSPSRVIASSEY